MGVAGNRGEVQLVASALYQAVMEYVQALQFGLARSDRMAKTARTYVVIGEKVVYRVSDGQIYEERGPYRLLCGHGIACHVPKHT